MASVKLSIKDQAAKVVAEKDVPEKLLAAPFNEGAVYEAIKNQLANKRQGNAHTKTVSNVTGSTKKPWRQKGTGRARAGSVKSALWRGGGITHGPLKRDFSYRIPKKVRQKAMLSVLSLLFKEGRLHVMEDFSLKKRSTSEISTLFANFFGDKYPKNKKVGLRVPLGLLYVLPEKTDEAVEQREILRSSISNLSWASAVSVNSLELKTLYYAKEVVFARSAFDSLVARYSKETVEQTGGAEELGASGVKTKVAEAKAPVAKKAAPEETPKEGL